MRFLKMRSRLPESKHLHPLSYYKRGRVSYMVSPWPRGNLAFLDTRCFTVPGNLLLNCYNGDISMGLPRRSLRLAPRNMTSNFRRFKNLNFLQQNNLSSHKLVGALVKRAAGRGRGEAEFLVFAWDKRGGGEGVCDLRYWSKDRALVAVEDRERENRRTAWR